jgi:uncharacterized protein (TIGR00661 family)
LNNPEIFNGTSKKPRVLVAPLDWGLGHATRCIPVIFKLLQQNCEVIVAAEGQVKFLLQQEFPTLDFIDLKGYRVRYSRNRYWFTVKILMQAPALFYRVLAEKRWLSKVIDDHKIDGVISDNRPGLNHKKIPCIYITHQLQIKTGNRFTESIAQKIHYHYINKFTACWVPDTPGKINLAGELSHPSAWPRVPVTFAGPLSRFEKTMAENKYKLCIVLSGPEPQRSIFEKKLLEDLQAFAGRVILIRGLPGQSMIPASKNPAVEIKNHLPAIALNTVILQSGMIICRSGYTSVMDLAKLQKRAILVPTPGQTEQEYLAAYLQKQQLFLCVEQKHFSLPAALKAAESFPFKEFICTENGYEKVIEEWVSGFQKDQ